MLHAFIFIKYIAFKCDEWGYNRMRYTEIIFIYVIFQPSCETSLETQNKNKLNQYTLELHNKVLCQTSGAGIEA